MLTSTINPYPTEVKGVQATGTTTTSTTGTANTTATTTTNSTATATATASPTTHPISPPNFNFGQLDSQTSIAAHPFHSHKSRSEDLHINILSHAQGVLRSHLYPTSPSALTNSPSQSKIHPHPPIQHTQAQAQAQFHSAHPPLQRYPDAQWTVPSPSSSRVMMPRPRPHSAHAGRLPFRWWETGLLSDPFSTSHGNTVLFPDEEEEEEEEDVRESIEPLDIDIDADADIDVDVDGMDMDTSHGMNKSHTHDMNEDEEVVESIELSTPPHRHAHPHLHTPSQPNAYGTSPSRGWHQPLGESHDEHLPPVSPSTRPVKSETMEHAEEERTWDEAQQNAGWRGYVQQRESWVRRAGLKRGGERDGVESREGKRGRVV